MSKSLVITLISVILLVIFTVQNSDTAILTIFFWDLKMSLALMLMILFLLGAGFGYFFHISVELRKKKKLVSGIK